MMREHPEGRVLVVYQHLPHYRYGVFRELDRAENLSFVFGSGAQQPGSGINTVPDKALKRRVSFTNYWLGPFLWQRGLIREVLTGRYAVVVFLGDWRYLSTWVAAIVGKAIGTHVVFWTIGWHKPESGVRKYIRGLFYSLADLLFLYGNTGRSIGIRLGETAAKLYVVGNSSSEPPSSESMAEQDHVKSFLRTFDSTSKSIVSVARLTPAKRLDMIISALALIEVDDRPNLILVGDGPERMSLEQRAKDSGVDVEFVGAIHDARALQMIYENCSCTVIPEAAGLTVLQSLRFGTPVITCDDPYRQMPEYEAIVHGHNGLLYSTGDIASLASAIEEVCEMDTTSGARLAQQCKDSLAHMWTPEAQAGLILKGLRRVIESAK